MSRSSALARMTPQQRMALRALVDAMGLVVPEGPAPRFRPSDTRAMPQHVLRRFFTAGNRPGEPEARRVNGFEYWVDFESSTNHLHHWLMRGAAGKGLRVWSASTDRPSSETLR